MIKLSKNKVKLISGLLVLSAAFFLLRARFLGHLLMWDEAWNILSLKAFLTNASGDPFYWYYRFHPPLYMFFAGILDPFAAGFDMRAEMLSFFFSYGTFLTVFFLSYRIAGWRYALLSGFFLCFMPESLGYDTWIKRDCLAMFTGYLGLFLMLERKHLWVAILLGLSVLSKESGMFFI